MNRVSTRNRYEKVLLFIGLSLAGLLSVPLPVSAGLQVDNLWAYKLSEMLFYMVVWLVFFKLTCSHHYLVCFAKCQVPDRNLSEKQC